MNYSTYAKLSGNGESMKSRNQRRDKKKEVLNNLDRLERKILKNQKKWKQKKEDKIQNDFWKNFYFSDDSTLAH